MESDLIASVQGYFNSASGAALALSVKMASMFISLLLFAGLIFVIYRISVLNKALVETEEFFTAPPVRIPKFSEKWESIRARAESDNPSDYKVAILEADAILDDVLERAGFYGETLGEKLKNTEKGQLANMEALWAAHRYRNAIAHDMDVNVSPADARQIIEIYERTLEDLEAI